MGRHHGALAVSYRQRLRSWLPQSQQSAVTSSRLAMLLAIRGDSPRVSS
jgi:hypothetical protein